MQFRSIPQGGIDRGTIYIDKVPRFLYTECTDFVGGWDLYTLKNQFIFRFPTMVDIETWIDELDK